MKMFSNRSYFEKESHPPQHTQNESLSAEPGLIDLTCNNPTQVLFDYPIGIQTMNLHLPTIHYLPDPQGALSTRQAIANYYKQRTQEDVLPQDIVLAAGTSELYSHLFDILADPGDAILVPHLNYPLIPILAQLRGLRLISYPIHFDGSWHLLESDFERLLNAPNHRIKALVCVSPHYPTGHCLKQEEYAFLEKLCARHQIALLVDEVFADYTLRSLGLFQNIKRPIIAQDCLMLVFSGLSKIALMPYLKLSFVIASGPSAIKQACLERLSFVSDAYLSVSSYAEQSIHQILPFLEDIQTRMRTRIAQNFKTLQQMASPVLDIPQTEGGFCAMIRFPKTQIKTAQEWQHYLLKKIQVKTLSACLFGDLPYPYLVVSLISKPSIFTLGVERLSQIKYESVILD